MIEKKSIDLQRYVTPSERNGLAALCLGLRGIVKPDILTARRYDEALIGTPSGRTMGVFVLQDMEDTHPGMWFVGFDWPDTPDLLALLIPKAIPIHYRLDTRTDVPYTQVQSFDCKINGTKSARLKITSLARVGAEVLQHMAYRHVDDIIQDIKRKGLWNPGQITVPMKDGHLIDGSHHLPSFDSITGSDPSLYEKEMTVETATPVLQALMGRRQQERPR